MRCDEGASTANRTDEPALAAAASAMLAALPSLSYDIERIWCKGRAKGCELILPTDRRATLGATPITKELASPISAGASPGGGGGGGGALDGSGAHTQPKCVAHRRTALAAEPPPVAASVSNASELPESARRVLHHAASSAWDCNTVILLFATADFHDLAINWAQVTRASRRRAHPAAARTPLPIPHRPSAPHRPTAPPAPPPAPPSHNSPTSPQAATRIGVTNFVLVAMDRPLGQILDRFERPPGLLLPRVASGDVTITKLNVIGERQRFGLRVLEAGFNVLFADLDALFLRSPAPILADGDIIGERIWGRPISVVKKWGAAICTGFYFVRSNPRVIAIFRHTQAMIVAKRLKQPKWQASDQWAINHAIDDQEVVWQTPTPMPGIADYRSKYVDDARAVGYTKRHRSKFVVLPHLHVARSCPILKHGTTPPPADDRIEQKKWRLWRSLLGKAYALHCFPPDSMPCPKQKHGEKGCDKSVIMGSAVHIHGEVVFDQRQGLWFMRDGWEAALKAPATTDFFAWLRSMFNGAAPGGAPSS